MTEHLLLPSRSQVLIRELEEGSIIRSHVLLLPPTTVELLHNIVGILGYGQSILTVKLGKHTLLMYLAIENLVHIIHYSPYINI